MRTFFASLLSVLLSACGTVGVGMSLPSDDMSPADASCLVMAGVTAVGYQNYDASCSPNPVATLYCGGRRFGSHFFRLLNGVRQACWQEDGFEPVCGDVSGKIKLDNGDAEHAPCLAIPITSKPDTLRYSTCNFMVRDQVNGGVCNSQALEGGYSAVYRCVNSLPTTFQSLAAN